MKNMSSDTGCGMPSIRSAAVLIFAVLNLAVFLVRMLSVMHYGTLFVTTGGESLTIYSVWKGMRHLPVYEWPFKYPFSISLYNYLFYDTYIVILRLIGAWDAGIETWGRLLTSLFAIVGAMAQWRLVQNLLNLHGIRCLLSLLFAVSLWLCTSLIRWWSLTIRPDIAAIALVMIALWVIMQQPIYNFAIAGVFFYLAWSFKQSVILAFIGVCLFLLFYKRWRDLLVIAAVFIALIAATLILGTPEFRFSVLVAPRLVSEYSFRHALRAEEFFLIANAYWILAPIALLGALRAQRIDNAVKLLLTVYVFALVAGFAAMGKVGASDNYMFEAFVAGSTLLQIAIFTLPGRLVTSLLLFGCVQPVLQLLMAPNTSHLFGTLRIATSDEYANAMALRRNLANLKKPIYTTDESFALPWISASDHAPAFVNDPVFHDATHFRCQKGGLEGMLKNGDIPTVMLRSGDTLFLKSLKLSYIKIGESYHQGSQYSIYIISNPAHSIVPRVK